MASRAFTLLEVLLSLILTVVLVLLVSSSVSVYLRASDVSRTAVQESQLARMVLKRIADDLRSTYMSASQTNSSPSQFQAGSPSTNSSDDDEVRDQNSIDSNVDPNELINATSGPGLYGTQEVLYIDVTRLPRIDNYQAMIAAGNKANFGLSHDISSVVYYVVPHGTTALTTDDLEATRGGLVRKAIDRVTSASIAFNGSTQTEFRQEDLLAPEVTALQIQYFDGTQWSLDWNSHIRNSLPAAVEVAIAVRREDDDRTSSPVQSSRKQFDIGNPGDITYRIMVTFPTVR